MTSTRHRKTSRRRGVVRDAAPLQIRLTAGERAALERKATAAGMTMTDFVRQHIGTAQVVNRQDWRRRTWLLANIANNLNQVSRWANTFCGAADAVQVVVALLRLERAVRAAEGFEDAQEDQLA